MTARDLLVYRDRADRRVELVRGRLMVSEPAGAEHGRVTLVIGAAILAYRRARAAATGEPIGYVVVADPGCWIERAPDTVRAPDVAYVRADRMPAGPVHGFLPLAPALAVEVRSPTDRAPDVAEKVAQWLAAGTALVWTIDPVRHVAHVYRADGSESAVPADGMLDGESVLPGFVLPMRDLFG